MSIPDEEARDERIAELEMQRDTWKRRALSQAAIRGGEKIAELTAENRRLRKALDIACAEIQDWGTYADEYFQDKWDLKAQTAEKFLKEAAE